MTEQVFAILLASAFTFGCVAIQALKQHAQPVTAILSIIAICLGSFVGLVSLAQKGQPGPRTEHTSIARSTH